MDSRWHGATGAHPGARSRLPWRTCAHSRGTRWRAAHWNTPRWPARAARAHTHASHGHPLARAAWRASRSPRRAVQWQAHSLPAGSRGRLATITFLALAERVHCRQEFSPGSSHWRKKIYCGVWRFPFFLALALSLWLICNVQKLAILLIKNLSHRYIIETGIGKRCDW